MERRALESRQALEIFLAIADVISSLLLRLRDVARDGIASASSYFTSAQMDLLRYQFPKLGEHPSARDTLRALAELGGYFGSKKSHPGWMTLWRGMRRLFEMEVGYHIAQSFRRQPQTCG